MSTKRKHGAGSGGRLADMSLPPEQRRRRKTKRVGGTPPAQLSHGTGRKAAKKRREGQAKMDRQRRRA